ncbi:MAG: hypothetical protein ABIS28_15940, partial [Caldimonas sp.]
MTAKNSASCSRSISASIEEAAEAVVIDTASAAGKVSAAGKFFSVGTTATPSSPPSGGRVSSSIRDVDITDATRGGNCARRSSDSLRIESNRDGTAPDFSVDGCWVGSHQREVPKAFFFGRHAAT